MNSLLLSVGNQIAFGKKKAIHRKKKAININRLAININSRALQRDINTPVLAVQRKIHLLFDF